MGERVGLALPGRLVRARICGALDPSMLEQGWIERTADPRPDLATRKRQAYALTHAGRRVLDAEACRLQAMVRAAGLQPLGEGGM